MSLTNIIIRAMTLIFHFLRLLYWLKTEKKAEIDKPKLKSFTLSGRFQRLIFNMILVFVILQLLGLNIFQFDQNNFIQIIGFFITIIGTIISILGRYQLGSNWAHGTNYQIKKDQELVTSGIYEYIRHPIYSGLAMAIIGSILVAESYLFIFFIFICFGSAYYQSKKEEIILEKHFGKKYIEYKKQSKMFIPYFY